MSSGPIRSGKEKPRTSGGRGARLQPFELNGTILQQFRKHPAIHHDTAEGLKKGKTRRHPWRGRIGAEFLQGGDDAGGGVVLQVAEQKVVLRRKGTSILQRHNCSTAADRTHVDSRTLLPRPPARSSCKYGSQAQPEPNPGRRRSSGRSTDGSRLVASCPATQTRTNLKQVHSDAISATIRQRIPVFRKPGALDRAAIAGPHHAPPRLDIQTKRTGILVRAPARSPRCLSRGDDEGTAPRGPGTTLGVLFGTCRRLHLVPKVQPVGNEEVGARGGNRTPDQGLMSPLLYR